MPKNLFEEWLRPRLQRGTAYPDRSFVLRSGMMSTTPKNGSGQSSRNKGQTEKSMP